MEDRLQVLREQMASDFQTTWKVMGETADRVDQLAREIGNVSEGLRQVQGRLRLMDQRFSLFMEAIQEEVRQRPHRREFDALEARVARLESKDPPAA